MLKTESVKNTKALASSGRTAKYPVCSRPGLQAFGRVEKLVDDSGERFVESTDVFMKL
jgi:hypothetical protein